MALHLQTCPTKKLFTGHGQNYVAVNGERYTRPVVVTAEAVHTDWTATDFARLTASDFDYFIALRPEIVLFGTGATQKFARPELFCQLTAAGIAIEFMDTPAACRTYNILVADDRIVVAAVLL